MSSTTTEPPPVVIRTAPLFFVNSVLAATVAVAAARVVDLVTTGIAAAVAGMQPVLTNREVVYRAAGPEAVEMAGIVGMLVVGVVLLLLYPGSRDRSVGRLTMLWAMLFCFQGGFSAIARQLRDDTSVLGGFVADLGTAQWLPTALAAGALLLLAGVAVGTAPAFLTFARHRSEVATRTERVRFMTQLAVIPAFLGPLLAVPMFMPDGDAGFVTGLPIAGAFIVVTFVASLFTMSFRPPEVIEERGLSFGLIAAVALVAVSLRLGLGPGVPLPPWNESLQLTLRP